MKQTIKTAALSMFIMLLSIAGTAQVNSEYDHSLDFANFKTYSFRGWQDNSDKLLNPFDKETIITAMKAQFTERGMTYEADSSKADVAVVLYIVLDPKTSVTAYTNYTGGLGYGAGWGWGMGVGGMGMGEASTTYSTDDYTEGTFVVDIYDLSTKKLAWQGVLKTIVEAKSSKRSKTIPQKIQKLMWQYPVKPNSK